MVLDHGIQTGLTLRSTLNVTCTKGCAETPAEASFSAATPEQTILAGARAMGRGREGRVLGARRVSGRGVWQRVRGWQRLLRDFMALIVDAEVVTEGDDNDGWRKLGGDRQARGERDRFGEVAHRAARLRWDWRCWQFKQAVPFSRLSWDTLLPSFPTCHRQAR